MGTSLLRTFKTRRQFYRLTISSKDSILSSWNKGFGDVYFALELIIFTAFFCNLTTSVTCWFLVCSQIWQPYPMCDSKRALYIVFNNLFQVQYLNFSRRTFSLLSLAFNMLILDDQVRDSCMGGPPHHPEFCSFPPSHLEKSLPSPRPPIDSLPPNFYSPYLKSVPPLH